MAERMAEAQRLVQSIAKQNGYLGEAFYARMDSDMRREVQEAMLAKDNLIGSMTILLARELYSKDVRFIFELLQNADDNHYSKARAAGSAPYVAFNLHPTKVVVDCNEDGFSEANLRALCSIGKSSKISGHGYIGEKGIGFKSVFKVAWKVHVESGDFSFIFTHRPGDSGMGMISPEWEVASNKSSSRLTRITLYLIDDDEAAERLKSIEAQLNDLQANMLLFLKNLQRIDVCIHGHDSEDDSEDVISFTRMTITMNEAKHKAVFRKRRDENGASQETQTHCHVTRHLITGLAKSANRTYSAAEEAAQTFSTSEVILAFPISEDSTPVIHAQQVFAFLPIRRLGFNFLIQADFVTMGNREDVVTSSARNLALLDGIAEAFIKTIHEMYSHTSLRYTWMRYLRNMKDYPWNDDYWKKLVEKIDDKIRKAEILEPRRRGPPRRARDLRYMSTNPRYYDNDGKPLFEDLPGRAEMYLSAGYALDDLEMLLPYGLVPMTGMQFLDRVKYDLKQPSSRMRSASSSDDWHTQVATTFQCAFLEGWTMFIEAMKALNILPLHDGTWVSANQGNFFLPKTKDGVAIPNDVKMNILAALPCRNAQRVKFFIGLGAQHVDADVVRAQILAKYPASAGTFLNAISIDLETSYAHLVFLYQTHTPENASQYGAATIKVHDTNNKLFWPSQGRGYFTSGDPYSLWQLSQQGRNEWFKENVSFLHPRYMQNTPRGSADLSWEACFQLLGVRHRPNLLATSGDSISDVCQYVNEELPTKFLGLLRYMWNSGDMPLASMVGVAEAMEGIEVPCQGKQRDIEDAYLPLPSLRQKASSLLGDDGDFLFMDVDASESWATDDDAAHWRFLKYLTVRVEDSLHFYIELLHCLIRSSWKRPLNRPSRVLSIYQRMHSRCEEAPNRQEAQKDLRQHPYLISLPGYNDEECLWSNGRQCRLDAPLNMQYKHAVLARYKVAFPGEDLTIVMQFFRETLDVPLCLWEDFVEEIKVLKGKDVSDFDRIRSQYEELDRRRRDWVVVDINTAKIREAFESESLIFVQNANGDYKWMKPSECLWSSANEIRDRISLSNHYDDDLEDFFVTVLCVSRLTIDMVYDQLEGLDSATATVKQAKDWLWALSAFLETETPKQTRTSTKLLKKAILPVRYPNGDVLLVSAAAVEFAVIDRRPLENMFRNKVKLLDFTLEEVYKLEPLLRWMKLRDRCLSKLIKETSVVDSALTYPLSVPVRHIWKKAHALTRVAAHLKSPRTRTADAAQDLHNLLLSAETLETDGISSILILNQDGAAVSVELERSEVHIADNDTSLTVYVPHDEVSQDVCFGSALPAELVRWLVTNTTTQQVEGRRDEAVAKVVTAILAARSTAAMDRILDMQGIPPDEEPATPTRPAAEPLRTSPASDTSSEDSEASTALTTPFATLSLNNGVPDRHYADSPTPDRTPYLRPSAAPAPPTPSAAARNQAQYRALLQHIVSCARDSCGRATPLALARLPRRGTASVSTFAGRHDLQAGAGDGDWLLPGCSSAFERDCKIGAAGELFVYSLLKHILLEGFGPENWQSTMRKYVAGVFLLAHPELRDMEPWVGGGRETSDIVVWDVHGMLVRYLVEGGYLDAGRWGGKKGVRCYVEVKSTFGRCEGLFWMSDRQYHLMSELTTENSIYMIFRVFDMTNGSIGARVYVDPDKMRQDGLLKFSTDKWTVTPGVGLFS